MKEKTLKPLTVIEYFRTIKDLAEEKNFDAVQLFYDNQEQIEKHSAKFPWDFNSQDVALEELKQAKGNKKNTKKILIAQLKDMLDEAGFSNNPEIERMLCFIIEL